MMRALSAMVLLISATVYAGEKTPADRLIQFAFEGCDYLRANFFDDDRPNPPAAALAPHFGKVVKATHRGSGTEFVLGSPRFPRWRVTYFERTVELTLPPNLHTSVADFERRLGRAQELGGDSATRPSSDQPTTTDDHVVPLELEFQPSTIRPLCRIHIESDGAARDLRNQRVLRFTFQD